MENITEEGGDSEEEKEAEAAGKEITKNVTEKGDDRENEVTTGEPRTKRGENKLGLSCAKLSTA